MIFVVALVALCYFGGNYCPTVLKKNKELLLGVVGGLVLSSFFGMRLEGLVSGLVPVVSGLVPDCNQVPKGSGGFAPESCGGNLADEAFCNAVPEKCN